MTAIAEAATTRDERRAVAAAKLRLRRASPRLSQPWLTRRVDERLPQNRRRSLRGALRGLVRDQLGNFCVVLATGSLDILITAARQGTGIALAPAVNCKEALASGALVQVLPDWTAVEGILHLVFASRRGMLPGVRAVIDFVAAALKSSAVP
jgi:DNA-binding transcriptional LysR family regulator